MSASTTRKTAHIVDTVDAIDTRVTTLENATHDHSSDFAAINHNHDSDYAALGHNHDASYAALSHNHDGVYQPAGSYATLNSNGVVPAGQLPSYVDDLQEYATTGDFPVAGTTGRLYLDIANNDVYRWSGSTYIKVSDAVSTSDEAARLSTARTITLSGDVSGSVSFDGSADATITTTVSGLAASNHNHDDDYAAINHNHDSDYAALSHNHTIAQVTGLQAALNGKAASGHNHDSDYAAINHNHDSDYAAAGHDHDGDYAPLTHNHDLVYAGINHNHDSDYAAANHNHDGVYQVAGSYAAANHNHDSDYAAANHNHDSDYAAANHNHDSAYAAANHNHDSDYAAASHAHNFNDLTGKTGGTGDYATTGHLVAGMGSGEAALTTNDGQGNASVTFNHTDRVPDITGNAGRIAVNVDSTTNPEMVFYVNANKTAGTASNLNARMSIKDTSVDFHDLDLTSIGDIEADTATFGGVVEGITTLNAGAATITGTVSAVNVSVSSGLVLSTGGSLVSSANWAQGGTSDFTGAVEMTSTLDVTGAVTMDSTLTVDDTVLIDEANLKLTTSDPVTHEPKLILECGDVGGYQRSIEFGFEGADNRKVNMYFPNNATGVGGKAKVLEQTTEGHIDILPQGVRLMRFDVDGAVQIGYTGHETGSALNSSSSPEGINLYKGRIRQASDTNVVNIMNDMSSNSTTNYFQFRRTGSVKGSIQTNGTSVSFNTSSDRRLKEAISDAGGMLAAVCSLEPKNFNFIGDKQKVTGLIAQDVEDNSHFGPSMVSEMHQDDDDPILALDYSRFVPHLIGACKELTTKVEQLEAELNALKA